MALFGSIGKAFAKVVSNPVVEVLFPPFALGNQGALAGISKISQAISPHAPTPSQVSHQDQTHVFFEQAPQYGNAPQPYAPSYGSFQSYGYDPYQQGGAPWAFSTPSPVYSTPQYQTFSAPAQDRTWEDLMAGATLFL